VKNLENQGVKRAKAETLMQLTRGLLLREEERAAEELLSKGDMENVCPLSSSFIFPSLGVLIERVTMMNRKPISTQQHSPNSELNNNLKPATIPSFYVP
jgi:hypothetical protein